MSVRSFWRKETAFLDKIVICTTIYQQINPISVTVLAILLCMLGGVKLHAQTVSDKAPEGDNSGITEVVTEEVSEAENPELPETVVKEVPILKILELTQPLINAEPVQTPKSPQNLVKEAPSKLQLPVNPKFLITPPHFIYPELMAPETIQNKQEVKLTDKADKIRRSSIR